MFDFNFNGKEDAFDSFVGYNMVFGEKKDNFEVDDWDEDNDDEDADDEDDSEDDDFDNEEDDADEDY